MLIGVAAGLLMGVASTLLVTASIRPDAVIALVVGVPASLGMLLILFSARRWLTTAGALLLGIGPGWLATLVIIEVASHG
jgi:hypothetical protein